MYLTRYQKPWGTGEKTHRMYDTMPQHWYLPHMTSNVYKTVGRCWSWKWDSAQTRNQWKLQLLLLVGALQFVSMDILRLPSRKNGGNQLVIIIAVSYSKHPRETLTGKTTPTKAPIISPYYCCISYGFSSYLLTDYELQFVKKDLYYAMLFLWTEKLTTTACHPQTSWKVEHYSCTDMARLRHYMADQQDDWDLYTQLLADT